MAQRWKCVNVGKIDLDTAGAAFLAGVTREDRVAILRGGEASEADLADPSVLCIEVGGSGRVAESNFDHHGEVVMSSATMQAYGHFWCPSIWVPEWPNGLNMRRAALFRHIKNLVDYIEILDLEGPRALEGYGKVEFPTLSDVFAGMLLQERNPLEQLHRGVEILETVSLGGSYDPFGTIRGFDSYAEAKAENNRRVAKAVGGAQWGSTKGGRRLAYLETDFYGAPGALYGQGAEIVVAYAPHFGNPPVPKFTIAGNGVIVTPVLERLNALEQGWGGPATGTILGSPRLGSKLTLDEVVRIVREAL